MNPHPTVLAIDAAWTAGQPSGVALVQRRGAGWHCLALAPSYRSVTELVEGIVADGSVTRFPDSGPDIPELLEAAGRGVMLSNKLGVTRTSNGSLKEWGTSERI